MLIPAGPEALTAEWLTQALQQNGVLTSSKVTSFETNVLTGEKGLMGQIARLRLTFDPVDTPAPSSLIAKFSAADPGRRARAHAAGWYQCEVHFYRELAPEIELRVPQCYYSDIDLDTGEHVLLLEDLAPAKSGSAEVPYGIEETKIAIRAIAGFHARWWEHPSLPEFGWVNRMGSPEVVSLHQDLYKATWQPFLDTLRPELPPAIIELGERFLDPERMEEYVMWHNGPPATLLHYDYRLDNLFFRADDPAFFAVADWQNLLWGRGIFDVSQFLGGNVSVEVRRAHEMDLLRGYHSILVERGVKGYSFDECFRDYRYAMLYGLVRKVIVIGHPNASDEEKRPFREFFWPRYSAALVDLNVAELVPD